MFAFRAIGGPRGIADESTLEVSGEKIRIKDEGITNAKLEQLLDTKASTDTGVAGTLYPNSLIGLTAQAETLADGSNDDIELGQLNVVTGNVVEGIIKDIGTATVGRITGIVNASGGVILITVADESNMKINGQGKRLSIVAGGYCTLFEQANDLFVILEASGVTLVAY
jgi:hypothetical protein